MYIQPIYTIYNTHIDAGNTSLNQNKILFFPYAIPSCSLLFSQDSFPSLHFCFSFLFLPFTELNCKNVLMVIKSSERRVKTIKIPTILNHIRNSSTGSCTIFSFCNKRFLAFCLSMLYLSSMALCATWCSDIQYELSWKEREEKNGLYYFFSFFFLFLIGWK